MCCQKCLFAVVINVYPHMFYIFVGCKHSCAIFKPENMAHSGLKMMLERKSFFYMAMIHPGTPQSSVGFIWYKILLS